MLWLHVGMPKTGTTSLQNFLVQNDDALLEHGAHYLRAGRGNTKQANGRITGNHNGIAIRLKHNPDDFDEIKSEMSEEILESGSDNLIISSEMLFDRRLDILFQNVLQQNQIRQYTKEITIVIYLRRYDSYLEAIYKQLVKNGKIPSDSSAFVSKRLARLMRPRSVLNYNFLLSRIKDQVGDSVNIRPRIFQKTDLINGSTTADFLSLMNIDSSDERFANPLMANRSFSRIASEILGDIARQDNHRAPRHRALMRKLQSSQHPEMFRSGDLFSTEESHEMFATFERLNQPLREKFFPEKQTLFLPPDQDKKLKLLQRGSGEEIEIRRKLTEVIKAEAGKL